MVKKDKPIPKAALEMIKRMCNTKELMKLWDDVDYANHDFDDLRCKIRVPPKQARAGCEYCTRPKGHLGPHVDYHLPEGRIEIWNKSKRDKLYK